MISSRKPLMWKRWLSWNESPETFLPLVFFIGMMIHAASFGLTDDEAYYWVLAQKPALGYAYHPPAVAWFIAFFQETLGWLFGKHSVALVRLPGVLCAALVLRLSMNWLRTAGVPKSRLLVAGCILLSVAGIYSLSWMVVPDLPLLLGFMILLVSVWSLIQENSSRVPLAGIFFGSALGILSKYSGVLGAFSGFLAVLLWVPRENKGKALAAIFFGSLAGAIPALIWNAQHEWVSILYQLKDRHGSGSVSWIRYGKFWMIQAIAVGPVILSAFLTALRAKHDRVSAFLFVWIVPAFLVFCVQPLWSDFKPHWAFMVWWPAALALAWGFGRGFEKRLAIAQVTYGIALGAVVLLSCHIPVGSALLHSFSKGPVDPKLDVTNDLYGWGDLSAWLHQKLSAEELSLPVVGSRYQTASQAGFALGRGARFTLLPKDLRSRDEWPDLDVSEEVPGALPRLKSRILFVTDNRYDAPPDFTDAKCVKKARFEKFRWSYSAKWIEVWLCEPGAARP